MGGRRKDVLYILLYINSIYCINATIVKSRWRCYKCSLYYFFNLSVPLKFFIIKNWGKQNKSLVRFVTFIRHWKELYSQNRLQSMHPLPSTGKCSICLIIIIIVVVIIIFEYNTYSALFNIYDVFHIWNIIQRNSNTVRGPM